MNYCPLELKGDSIPYPWARSDQGAAPWKSLKGSRLISMVQRVSLGTLISTWIPSLPAKDEDVLFFKPKMSETYTSLFWEIFSTWFCPRSLLQMRSVDGMSSKWASLLSLLCGVLMKLTLSSSIESCLGWRIQRLILSAGKPRICPQSHRHFRAYSWEPVSENIFWMLQS